MGWLIALGVLTLIAIIPVGVSAAYDEDGPCVKVIIGPIHISAFPAKKRENKASSAKVQKKNGVKQTEKKSAPQKKKGGNISDFLPLVDTVLDFIAGFGRKIRIHNLKLKLILGGGDPSDLALNYGRGWAALGNLLPLLERAFVIQKRELEVECDFLADTTTIIAGVDLSITVGRVISLIAVDGVPVIRQFLKLKKIRKGGAKA